MEPQATPLSVVMPVYNALPSLDDSINSILTQTFTDFEFVIFDDASTDGTVGRLRRWAARDQRIKLHENKMRLGLSGSSNAVVTQARAAIVARMDADDVAHPDRLKRQWQIIKHQADVAVVGTLCNGIDASGREVVRVIGGDRYAAPVTFPFRTVRQCFVAKGSTESAATTELPALET